MTRRIKDALIGVGYLVVILALVTLSIMIYNRDFVSYVSVALHTDQVGNALQEGSDVKVRGVLVGRVGSITTSGTGATSGRVPEAQCSTSTRARSAASGSSA